VVPWFYPNQHPKWHLDQFSRFFAQLMADALQWAPLSPKLSKLSKLREEDDHNIRAGTQELRSSTEYDGMLACKTSQVERC